MNVFNGFTNDEKGCKESHEEEEANEEASEEEATTGTTTNDDTTNGDGLWSSNVWERGWYDATAEESKSIDCRSS